MFLWMILYRINAELKPVTDNHTFSEQLPSSSHVPLFCNKATGLDISRFSFVSDPGLDFL